MALINTLIKTLYSRRLRAIDRFRRHPLDTQDGQLRLLLSYGAQTDYFSRYKAAEISSAEEFRTKIPIVAYDDLQADIERMRSGERDILWPGRTRWFARSSGTSGARSKYIPVTSEVLDGCHFRGGRDTVGLFAHQRPDSRAFSGRTLTLGGSHQIDCLGRGTHSGDLSAVMIQNTPWIASLVREPSKQIALMGDFEQKVEAICRECTGKNITSFAGVPSWNLVLMNRVLEYCGAATLLDVWPEMSLFIHGGVNFGPYREQYRKLIPTPAMHYMETYNASEGFFALQDDLADSAMLLMLDYGVYYEFLPLRDLGDPSKAVPLSGIEKGVNYAMIISTCGGLWRYMIGDTVEFTSTDPYKIRITGRTTGYINTFGEELMIDNAERAMCAACAATGAKVHEYTAAPIYMVAGAEGQKGGHEWVVEFSTPPGDPLLFAEALDNALKELNSDYAAKRHNNTTLNAPKLVVAPPQTFYRWMEKQGKLGGQNKVLRLSNNRQLIEQVLTLI